MALLLGVGLLLAAGADAQIVGKPPQTSTAPLPVVMAAPRQTPAPVVAPQPTPDPKPQSKPESTPESKPPVQAPRPSPPSKPASKARRPGPRLRVTAEDA